MSKSTKQMVVKEPPREAIEEQERTPLQSGAIAHAQARYAMAQARPRSVEQARVELLRECESYAFAEKARYSLARGRETISDFSVRLAGAASRVWQNMMTEVQIVNETPELRVLRVTVVDLEANNSWGGEVSVEKKVLRKKRPPDNPPPERFNAFGEPLYAVAASEEEMAIKTAAQVSKAARSAILRHLPVWLKEECEEKLAQTVQAGVENSKTKVLRKLVESYGELGIQPRQLEGFLGHAVGQSSAKEVETLRGLWVGIRDGHTTWVEALATRGGALTQLQPAPEGEGASPEEAPQEERPQSRTRQLGAALRKTGRRKA